MANKWLKQWLFKRENILYFWENLNGNLTFKKKVKLKGVNTSYKSGNKMFSIEEQNPTRIIDNIRIYDMLYPEGSMLYFKEYANPLSAEKYNVLVGTKAVQQILTGISTNKKEQLMYLIGGCALGLVCGLLIMNMIMQNKMKELYEQIVELSKNINPFIELVRGLWKH